MSAIPSWAVRGAKCVAVDRMQAEAEPLSGLAIAPSDIFTILDTMEDERGAFCRTRHDQTGYEHELTEWARLSRFRPLTRQEDDLEAHFTALLDVREPVGV